MRIIGIDLSGPTNIKGTALASFANNDSSCRDGKIIRHAGDNDIYEYIRDRLKTEEVVIGIDAPLSYNPGGGDRSVESNLRAYAQEAGLAPGSIMPPTMTRMVYLTLRGIAVARMLQTLSSRGVCIIETHPASVFAFHGASVEDIQCLKDSGNARANLKNWLNNHGIPVLSLNSEVDHHSLCACAAAMGALKWYRGTSVWRQPAAPPHHPFDCAC